MRGGAVGVTREVESAGRRKPVRRRKRARPARRGRSVWIAGTVEVVAVLTAALIAAVTWLGYIAARFVGAGLWSHVLPFAGGVVLFGAAAAVLVRGWLAARGWLLARVPLAPAALALVAAGTQLWFTTSPAFDIEVQNLRLLVGGTAEAERAAIAHQVFASYRRADLAALERLWQRARPYEAAVHEAAGAFGIDAELLMGVAATESSFDPRDSVDRGRGLFQITAPPAGAVEDVQRRLSVAQLDPHDARHNAFMGAATLRRYLDEMRGDLFLGLLAYNIGPRNGGLRGIMAQYGARDFVTIQPYLQHLPGNYPIRVLSAALAYRLWRRQGVLPHYERGDNARQIQDVGIPGLAD